jgi:hypothetical protein
MVEPIGITLAALSLTEPAIRGFERLCNIVDSYRSASKYAHRLGVQLYSFKSYLELSEEWYDEHKVTIKDEEILGQILQNLKESINECSEKLDRDKPFKNNFVRKLANAVRENEYVKNLIFAAKGEKQLEKLLDKIDLWVKHTKMHMDTISDDEMKKFIDSGLDNIRQETERLSKTCNETGTEIKIVLEKMEVDKFDADDVKEEIKFITEKAEDEEIVRARRGNQIFNAGHSHNQGNQGWNEVGGQTINNYNTFGNATK